MRLTGILGRLLILFGLAGAVPVGAQAEAEDSFARRAADLVILVNGGGKAEEIFSPAFLSQISEAQVRTVAQQLRAQIGRARTVQSIARKSPTSGSVTLDFERGTATFDVVVASAASHLIEGLLVTKTALKDDSLARVTAEIAALAGESSLAVVRLGEGPPAMMTAVEAEQPLAIGSTFKLFILAELSRQVTTGERDWNDVVALDRRSLPSGQLRDWPLGSPLTLHTLAALMISVSDNSATDMLLHTLGRENVEAILPSLGVTAAARNRPFLSTIEAFALKSGGDELLRRWKAGNEVERRATLAALAPIDPSSLEIARLGVSPAAIQTVEWFASAEDMVRTMDWLRQNGDSTALDVLAINPGVSEETAGEFAYLGFKGGSEPGVLNVTYLARTKAGRWYAVSGSWNDPANTLDEAKFIGLMTRALSLLTEAPAA